MVEIYLSTKFLLYARREIFKILNADNFRTEARTAFSAEFSAKKYSSSCSLASKRVNRCWVGGCAVILPFWRLLWHLLLDGQLEQWAALALAPGFKICGFLLYCRLPNRCCCWQGCSQIFPISNTLAFADHPRHKRHKIWSCSTQNPN